jgi:hypothetical protein
MAAESCVHASVTEKRPRALPRLALLNRWMRAGPTAVRGRAGSARAGERVVGATSIPAQS